MSLRDAIIDNNFFLKGCMRKMFIVGMGLISLFISQQALAETCHVTLGPEDSIQAAIDHLPKDGSQQNICLTAGTFELTQMLHINRDNVQLKGQGNNTVLKTPQDAAYPTLVIGQYDKPAPDHAIVNITIADLEIIGSDTDQEFMPSLPYLSISGIVVRRGKHINLVGLNVRRCRSACLLTEQFSKDILIERSRVAKARWDGVSFNSTSQVIMRDNVIVDNMAAGITAENLEDSLLMNNRIEHNGSHGAYLSNSHRNMVIENKFNHNKLSGIFLACAIRFREPLRCWDNSMSGDNIFKFNTFTGNEYGYSVGADAAANCTKSDFRPNIWEDNQADTTNLDPPKQYYGACTTDIPQSAVKK
jgi:hypothetical protein